MTHDDILNMPAGREMDALIAKEITNLEKAKEGVWYWIDGYLDECPDYSTDIAAAWKVVEKMKEKGWYFQLYDMVELSEWMARFTDVPGVGVVMKDSRGYSDTAPLAICRAALLAVTVNP